MPTFVFILRSTCSQCGEIYRLCPCSKYADADVCERVENFALVLVYWAGNLALGGIGKILHKSSKTLQISRSPVLEVCSGDGQSRGYFPAEFCVIGEVDMEEEEPAFKGVLDAINNLAAEAVVGTRALAHGLFQTLAVELLGDWEIDSVSCRHPCLITGDVG